MATDYGRCMSLTTDLAPRWRIVSGQQVVAEAVARRWYTERGTLRYDPDYGTDARGMVGESMTPRQIAGWESALEREAEKDERVQACEVTVTYNASTAKATIKGEITTASGTFNLIVSVDDLTVELLEIG